MGLSRSWGLGFVYLLVCSEERCWVGGEGSRGRVGGLGCEFGWSYRRLWLVFVGTFFFFCGL